MYLIKTSFHAVYKLFLYGSSSPAKPKVLLLEPTSTAAININSNTKHSGQGKVLNYAHKAELRNKYSEVEIIIIKEISMVSSKLFKQMHKLLNKIFSSRQDFPFGRKPALYYEDPYHLLLFRAKPVFAFKNAETMEGFISMDLLRKFKLAKLNQLMRQDDKMFANVLNKIKIGKIDLKSSN